MTVKLLTEHNLEFLSLKGGCTGLSESTRVKCHIVGNTCHGSIPSIQHKNGLIIDLRYFILLHVAKNVSRAETLMRLPKSI